MLVYAMRAQASAHTTPMSQPIGAACACAYGIAEHASRGHEGSRWPGRIIIPSTVLATIGRIRKTFSRVDGANLQDIGIGNIEYFCIH